MSRLCLVVSALLSIFVLSCAFAGKPTSTGMAGDSHIVGVITDIEGHPLPMAEVSLTGPSLGGCRVTITDTDGSYHFCKLPPGAEYELFVDLTGYRRFGYKHLSLRPFATLRVNMRMTVCSVLDYLDGQSIPQIDYTSTGGGLLWQYDTNAIYPTVAVK